MENIEKSSDLDVKRVECLEIYSAITLYGNRNLAKGFIDLLGVIRGYKVEKKEYDEDLMKQFREFEDLMQADLDISIKPIEKWF